MRKPDQVIGVDYLSRWYVIPRNKFFNIYLHKISGNDDDRALHDHPWYNVSIILSGKLIEVTKNGRSVLGGWRRLRFRSGSSAHRLEVLESPVWTLFLTGPRYREWGFYCPNGWRHWRIFCDPVDSGKVGRGCD